MTLVCQVASSEGGGRPLEMKEATTEEDLFLRVLGAKAGCGNGLRAVSVPPDHSEVPITVKLAPCANVVISAVSTQSRDDGSWLAQTGIPNSGRRIRSRRTQGQLA